MINTYFGVLSDERKICWDNGDKNPYAVLKNEILVSDLFLNDLSDCFHDEIWIDWGSNASRTTGKEILDKLKEKYDYTSSRSIDPNEQYGLITIEEACTYSDIADALEE